jgi:hypothetical protein
VENWSAFAPDFRELEENVEYHERESEFDVKDEDRSLDGLDSITSPNKKQRLDVNGNVKKLNNDDIDIDVVTQQRIEALVSSDDDDINDQLVYLPSAPDIEDPEIEFTTKNTILTHQSSTDPDQTYEIKLQTPPVYDAHPYYGGTKQARTITNQDIKRDGRHRRKGHQSDGEPHNVLLPKSIDAAVATVTNNPKRLVPTNGGSGGGGSSSSGTTTIVIQTSESKGQRTRSARLEGKKGSAGHHRSSTDNDTDFVPH